MKKLLSTLLLLCLCAVAWADKVKIDELYYGLDEQKLTAILLPAPFGEEYEGEITVPAEVLFEDKVYSVFGIDSRHSIAIAR